MTWELNDGSKLTLDNISAFLSSFSIRLFTGRGLPTMTLEVQYGDDNPHYELGSKVTGSISASESGTTYKINGYVYKMIESSSTIYEILLRPLEYVSEVDTNTYDSVKSILSEHEVVDSGTSNLAICTIHGFGDYPVNIVDRVAAGAVNGVYGRSYDKLIIRELDSAPDYIPSINNNTIDGSSIEVYNKYSDAITYSESGELITELSGSGTYLSINPDYEEFTNNLISNKKFSACSTVGVKVNTLLPYEPGLIINTTNINNINNPKVPRIMYVRDVLVNYDGSKLSMDVTLAAIANRK